MKKWLLIGCGFFFIGLGTVGIFLPLLPTTPFLLLAAYCFLKSSPENYQWLIQNKLYGKYIRDYIEKRRISPGVKILSLFLLWLSLGYTIIFVIPGLWFRIGAGIILISVSLHILFIRSKNE
jgi:uncharacterized protein